MSAERLPIVEELLPPPDPWDMALRFAGLPHLLFLDSAERHPLRGRYSFLAADPAEWLEWSNTQPHSDPFADVKRRLARFSLPSVPHLPPFQGGIAGLFGYGLQHVVERVPRPRFDDYGMPDLGLGIYDWVVAFDHLADRAWLISTGYPDADPARAATRLEEARRLIHKLPVAGDRAMDADCLSARELAPQFRLPGRPEVTSNFDRGGYQAAVGRVIDYIHAGDCFQVNLSQRLLHPQTLQPLELYHRLRERNPAPFAGYLDLGRFVIVSASPERFVRVAGGEVETRPIKGTRPRGTSAADDWRLMEQLRLSPKDRAENVMIVDLLRNDLGRVCAYGSVRVPRVCEVESFRFVHHLVSEVRGTLRPGETAIDLLRAAFPGGSVTGAPKVRAMEIIAALEPTVRGAYCGCLGYVGFNGSADSNILIRTFTAGRGWLQFPVGGGIVADSDPEHEYEETLHKAAGLLRSLEK